MKRERRKGQPTARTRGSHKDKRALLGGLAGGAAIAMGTPGYAVPIGHYPPNPIEIGMDAKGFVDVDDDGTDDVQFWLRASDGWQGGSWEATADAIYLTTYLIGNEGPFVGGIPGYEVGVTQRFGAGVLIGPGEGGTTSPIYGYTDLGYNVAYMNPPHSSFYGGQFVNNRGFMGITFKIGFDTHWGWVEAELVNPTGDKSAKPASDPLIRIHGWGYEDEADTGIVTGAPEPGTLAGLALGAAAVVGGRRPKS